MWTAIGIILFALGLLASIAWHEAGHLFFAKLFGVRVTQYMVGFGPTLFSHTGGGTEYGLKAIPLGGYIRMIGMVPPGKHQEAGPFTGPFRAIRKLIEDSRTADRRHVTDDDHGRQFYQLHPFKRILIMFGGPLQNLIIALGLFAVIMLGVGLPTTVPTIASVSQCVLPATATSTDCPAGYTPTPAKLAGLLPGDKTISFDGQPVTSWDQMISIIHASAGKAVGMVYERGGATIAVRIPVAANQIAVFDAAGNLTGTTTGGYLGIRAGTEYQKQSFGAAVGLAGDFINQAGHAILAVPSRIPALFGSIFEGKPRSQDSPMGVVGASRFGGEIMSSVAPGKDKLLLFLQLLAGFNMSLFLLNLLPMLPLDGGHILGAVIEWVRRGWAKARRRADPGPFDVAKLMPVAYAVAMVFIALSVLTLVADVINPVKML